MVGRRADADLEYVVFYHHYRGLWYLAEAFVMRDHIPHGTEIKPVYGEVEGLGFPCNWRRVLLLVVEEDENTRYWVLYKLENGVWVVARVFQVQLEVEVGNSMEDETSGEDIDVVSEE